MPNSTATSQFGAPRYTMARRLARWREAVAAILPHPEAEDFADVIGRRTYVEVSISKGPLNRG